MVQTKSENNNKKISVLTVRPQDLANIVLFLCSEDAKAITGAAIPTYGLAL